MGSVNEKCPHGVTKHARDQFAHTCYRCAPAGTPDFTGLTASQLDGHDSVTRDTKMTKPEPGTNESFRPSSARLTPSGGLFHVAGAPEPDPELLELEKIVTSFLRIEREARARTLAYLQSRFGA